MFYFKTISPISPHPAVRDHGCFQFILFVDQITDIGTEMCI